jgi:hypothetical protein
MKARRLFSHVLIFVLKLKFSQPLSIVIFNLVTRNSEEPTPKRGIPPELVQAFPSRKENFLHQIVHEIGPWNQPAPDISVEVVCVACYKLSRRLAVFA